MQESGGFGPVAWAVSDLNTRESLRNCDSNRSLSASVKKTFPLREPWPCDPLGETAFQPLIWRFWGWFIHVSSSPAECPGSIGIGSSLYVAAANYARRSTSEDRWERPEGYRLRMRDRGQLRWAIYAPAVIGVDSRAYGQSKYWESAN